MLTDKQTQKAIRSGQRLAKDWTRDVAATGRVLTADRVQRIAAQDARYAYNNPEKQAAHAAVVARTMGRAVLPLAEYVAMSEAMSV